MYPFNSDFIIELYPTGGRRKVIRMPSVNESRNEIIDAAKALREGMASAQVVCRRSGEVIPCP